MPMSMDGLYARYALPQIPEAESGQQSGQIFTIYNVYRLVLALILLISFYFRVPTSPLGSIDASLFLNICIFYTGFNILTLVVPLLRLPAHIEGLQRSAVFIIDILTLALISYTCGGVDSGMAHLMIVPIAAGSILFGIRMSTFYAAIATIAAIYSEVLGYLSTSSGESYYVQAGLLGFTLFATSLSLQYLGGRIRQKDVITHAQAASIRSLQEINQQIIERMQTGIVVVDQEAQVLNFNDSARKLLSDPAQAQDLLDEDLVLPPILLDQLRDWQLDHGQRAQPFRVVENGREVQANFTWLQGEPDSSILIFLEDHTQLSSRAQHLKLMALGRLTASIAHEVRNPLGAISHASQLLEESPSITGADQRLLGIINTHTKRVNAIIQNILDLSRHRQEVPEIIDAGAWIADFTARLANSYPHPIDVDLDIGPDPVNIRFNTSQLEQLLTNVCDNGLRYSRAHTGHARIAMRVAKHPFTGLPMLDVLDDGPGVATEKQEQIFEPFFTTEPSGTGLGLFICREICEANQAQIFFRRADNDRSCFRIIFAHPDRLIN
jgi:two-component system sensor histidine kinase PilS (NtrC family)